MYKRFIPMARGTMLVLLLTGAMVAGLPVAGMGKAHPPFSVKDASGYGRQADKPFSGKLIAGNRHKGKTKKHHFPSSDDQKRFRKNLKEWETLPPGKKKVLRHRMHQWRELSPQERSLYQKRFEQLQQLSPDTQERIRKQLKHWDNLSPQEQQEFRQNFPNR